MMQRVPTTPAAASVAAAASGKSAAMALPTQIHRGVERRPSKVRAFSLFFLLADRCSEDDIAICFFPFRESSDAKRGIGGVLGRGGGDDDDEKKRRKNERPARAKTSFLFRFCRSFFLFDQLVGISRRF